MLVNNYISPVEFLVWTVLFTHILVVITGGGSKHKSSDRDPSQTSGKNQVKNRLGHILLIVFIDSQTHYFFYYLLFSINTSLKEKKNFSSRIK